MPEKIKKLVKPYDFVIVISLVLLSFLPFFLLSEDKGENIDSDLYAVISIDGEEVDRILLTGNEKNELLVFYPGPDQYNIVEIDGERIRNKEDNSPQQIAVKRDWIQEAGETSINLPHRFLIEIVSEEAIDSEIDILPQ